MSEPRWLDPIEQQAWRSLINGFASLMEVLDRSMQADSAMPHSYFEVLVPLSEHPDRAMRMSELASVTRSSRSRLSHAVSRLEERGWVRRTSDPRDKRGQVAELTDEGFAVMAAAAPAHVAAVRRYLIDRLTPAQLQAMTEIGQVLLASTAEPAAPSTRS